jgi:hypothetical protein
MTPYFLYIKLPPRRSFVIFLPLDDVLFRWALLLLVVAAARGPSLLFFRKSHPLLLHEHQVLILVRVTEGMPDSLIVGLESSNEIINR